MSTPKDNEEYGLTPKGYCYLEHISWERLCEWAATEAKNRGMEGIPCIVLDDEGGDIITVFRSPKP